MASGNVGVYQTEGGKRSEIQLTNPAGIELTLLNALVRGVLFRVCFFFLVVIDVGGGERFGMCLVGVLAISCLITINVFKLSNLPSTGCKRNSMSNDTYIVLQVCA